MNPAEVCTEQGEQNGTVEHASHTISLASSDFPLGDIFLSFR